METDRVQPWRCFRADAFLDQVVLVTGAAGGMGSEIVRAFHACGATVVGTDRVSEGPGDLYVRASVQSPGEVDGLFAAVDQAYGRLNHVIHAAAVIASTRFLAADAHHWRTVLDINLVGAFSVVQRALERLVQAKRGSIVLIASDAGFRGGGGLVADAPYAASKAGILSMVKSTSREFADSGVRINAIAPGPCDTPMHSALPAEFKERIAATIPLRRMGRPEDIAGGALFLCSEAAQFVHGAVLDIDGGAMLR